MTLKEIRKTRLASQKIDSSEFKTAGEIVHWMGAMQAQDYHMAKWAAGLRTLPSSDEAIAEAFNRGEIIRTHLLRPTWHFVSPEDIWWILELTGPQIRASMKSRDKVLELSEPLYVKSNNIIEKALTRQKHQTREDLSKEIIKIGINTEENRLSHLLMRAELDGIICSGPVINKKLTFDLLAERVPRKKNILREESLAKIAERYFTSRSPATIRDFVWWSGLPVKDARKAIESIKSLFFTESTGSELYYIRSSPDSASGNENSVHLLPAYDEFLISYKDRSASFTTADIKKTVSENGIFYPIIVVDGEVKGLWKRITRPEKVIIELSLYQKLNKKLKNLIEEKAFVFGQFLHKETEIRFVV